MKTVFIQNQLDIKKKVNEMKVPELKHYEGSWIVTNKKTGESREIFDRKTIEQLRSDLWEAQPIGTYLAQLNKHAAGEDRS
jgi:hypothetical protein